MAQDAKERLIEPINMVSVDLTGTPEQFFEKNPHLKEATIFVDNVIIPVFPQHKPKEALFAVLLTWFKSPCIRIQLDKRMEQAGMLAGLINSKQSVETETDIRKKDGICKQYFDNFLIFQQDFHHQYCIHNEMIISKLQALVSKSMDEPLTESSGITHDDIAKYFKEIREWWKTAQAMRESNYATKILSEYIISQYKVDDSQEMPKMPKLVDGSASDKFKIISKSVKPEAGDY